MLKAGRTLSSLAALSLMLTGCGGGGSSSGGGGTSISPTPSPTPTPTTSACSLRDRQAWVLAQLQEWYLFPDQLATNVDPAAFTNIDDYIDALVAPARAQGKDKFFTFITSIAEENAFFNSGATAGFGVRLVYDSSTRLFVADAFEGAPALAAGIDRGTEIVGIGTSTGNVQSVASLVASGGTAAVSNALGPSTAGTVRVLQFRTAGASATTTATVTKGEFEIPPISPRFGAQIITDRGRQVGYINMRTFISTSDAALRTSFANLQSQGATEFVIDLRYNGGGLVRTAELFGDLLGGNRQTSEVFSRTEFRASKASNNSVRNFRRESGAVSPTKIAFVGTSATASASELVMNSFLPYLGNNIALVGSNTSGKPVGQIGLDRAACDDRLRVVAFATKNRDGQGDYFNGIAPFFPRTCAASDNILQPLGSASETSTRAGLDFLATGSCGSAISGSTALARDGLNETGRGRVQELLSPEPSEMSVAQREVPGFY